MATIGYATLSVIPSIEGISGNLSQQLGAPLVSAGRRAGQDAGRAVASGIAAARADVDKATEALAKSHDKVADAAGKVTVAENQLQALVARGVTDAGRLSAAEEKVAAARRKSLAATRENEKAVRDLASAEERASTATDDVADSAERVSGGFRSMFSGLDGGTKSLLAFGTGAAGVAGAMDLMGKAMDQEKSVSKLNASLGATGQMAADFGAAAKGVFASGVGESMGEVADAVGLVQSSFATLGFEGDATLEQATTRALNFADVFDTDISSAVQAASTLVTNGLARDSTEAFDMLTTSFQNVPAAMRDELPEIIQEYSTNFRALGFDGAESFNLLVSAAGQGKFALDKTGDALKEFTILASSGDKGVAEAFTAIGADAALMANDVAIGGDQAQYALQQTAEKLLALEDPAAIAQNAIALFGTPLEDLSVDQIPAFLQGIAGAPDVMADFAGATDEMGSILNDNAAAKLETFKRGIESSIVGVLGEQALPMMGEFTGALEENEGSMLATIAGMTGMGGALAGMEQAKGVFDSAKEGALGLKDGFMQAKDTASAAATSVKSAATAVKSWQIGAKIAAAASATWTGIQWALNAAMNANPIGIIVIAVAALVAGVILAYQHSETFRNIVQAAWEGIKTAASAAWEGVIKPAFDGFMIAMHAVGDAAMWLWNTVMVPAFTAIKFVIDVAWFAIQVAFKLFEMAITSLGNLVMWLWNNAITPAFNAIGAVISAVWNATIMPLFDLFKLGLQAIGDAATWLWNNAIMPAWNGIGTAIDTVWNGVVLPVFDLWKAGVQALGDIGMWLWNNAITPAFEGIKGAISTAWDFVKPILGWIGDGIGALGDIAARVGEAMRTAFDGVVNALKAPARAIGGLLAKIPDKILGIDVPGVGQLHEWGASLQALRSGGPVVGPGTGTSDDVLLWGSNGEFMVNAKATAQNLPLLEAINAGWTPSVQDLYGMLPEFATGGRIGDAMDYAKSMDPVGYQMGGFSTSSIDCSGFVAAVVNKAMGLDPYDSRMSTMNEGEWLAAKGAQMGLGGAGDLRIGWYDNGGGAFGHTAGTFPDGTNFESNGSEGVVIGGSTGYDDPMFTDHAFFPGSMFLGGDLGGGSYTASPSIFGGGGSGGSGGGSGLSGGGGSASGGGGGSATPSTPGGTGGTAAGDGTPVFVTNWPSGSTPSASSTSSASAPYTPGGVGAAPQQTDAEAASWQETTSKNFNDGMAGAGKAFLDGQLSGMPFGDTIGKARDRVNNITIIVQDMHEAVMKLRTLEKQQALAPGSRF